MLFARVAAGSVALAATPSRLAKARIVADLLTEADLAELPAVAAYVAGQLPQRRIGLGWRRVAALPAASGEPSLTVATVNDTFDRMAQLAGGGSVADRRALAEGLFAAATVDEQRLLRGLITEDVRQGAGDGVLLTAIALATDVPEAKVRRAVMLAGSPSEVVVAARAGGAEALDRIGLVVGRPVRPMLAASAPTVAEAGFEGGESPSKASEFVVDTKLDGIRLQVHRDGTDVRLFTRSLDDITERLPEVVDTVLSIRAQTLVLDGEAIALSPSGRPEPFQVTGARTASSADPVALSRSTPLRAYFFDLLHLDGRDLLDEPMSARRDRLETLVGPLSTRVLRTTDPREAQDFFDKVVSEGHEGVVVKAADAPYAAGRRGAGWVKVKPRHTVDLVVLAVERGSGRRKGWLSNIHLGARDETTGELRMVGKTFKGMTDEMLRWQTARFEQLAVDDDGWTVTLRPEQVVEIAFDGVQRSRRYPSGLALRFARVVRYRDDKPPSDADTIATLIDLAGWDATTKE